VDDSKAKESGGMDIDLIDVYQKQVRCVVEFAAPAWTSNLKQYEARQIERVQKAALAIIFQDRYESTSTSWPYFTLFKTKGHLP